MGTRTEYGLFRRTPKFLSPLSSNRMNTPMCMRPTQAASGQEGLTVKTTHTHYDVMSQREGSTDTHTQYDVMSHREGNMTHTDPLWRRSGRTGLGPVCPGHRCFSSQRTKTSETHTHTHTHSEELAHSTVSRARDLLRNVELNEMPGAKKKKTVD